MAKSKTDNFLKAIKKHAKAQQSAMQGEVRQLKTARLKEAEEQAKRDSERLLREKLTEKHNRQTAMLASKTQEGQRKLYAERVNMTDEVFRLAADKLRAYTETEAYADHLMESAREIAAYFGGRDCMLYLGEHDMDRAQALKSVFEGAVQVQADKTIRIGGVKGYCESLRVIADETLDSKLEAQREWFVENAALSVL